MLIKCNTYTDNCIMARTLRVQLGGLTGLQIGGLTLGGILILGIIIGVVIYYMRGDKQATQDSPTTVQDNPEICSRKTDCAPGFLCSRAGQCFPGCEHASDCPTGEDCIQGQCATKEGKQSSSLQGTEWEDENWKPGSGDYSTTSGAGYVRKFRGGVGDNVEMKFTIKESATELCAPASAPVVAFGEVKIKNDEGVGVEWTYLKNDSHTSDFEKWNCCWHRGDDIEWNMKYLGDARHNPTYDSGLLSVFTPEQAGKMLRKTIIDVRECPTTPWEPCPDGYSPYGKIGNQFCCKGTVSPTKSSCEGQACAQATTDHQGASWCSTVKNWEPEPCPPGLKPYGGPNSQFCCSSEPVDGKCYQTEFACANKTLNPQGKPWCETNHNYRPKTLKMRGGAGNWCVVSAQGIRCNAIPSQATTFEIREYPQTPEGYIPFAMKSPRSNKWCHYTSLGFRCDSSSVKPKNVFHRVGQSDESYGIFANNQLWCSDENSRNGGVVCNRGGVGGWEKFHLVIGTGPMKGGGPSGNPVVQNAPQ
jgi:hypothetical protein